MSVFSYRPFIPPVRSDAIRRALRQFLAENLPDLPPADRANCWVVSDPAFSRKLGKAGFIGMLLPKSFGGGERHPLERYIVLEELLAAGAPVGAHWIADRQTAPLILRYGSDAQKQKYLPGMAKGEVFSCIGLSEPNAGSDLAGIRTSARKVSDGWRISGQKVWTTNAHHAHVMLALVRSEAGSTRHTGLSQFLIDLDLPGIQIKPIHDLRGRHEFNEVFFDDVLVPDGALIGVEGEGWKQVTAELALERSGPERYLSSHVLLTAFIDAFRTSTDPLVVELIGRLTADLWTLRHMSMSVAATLASGEDPMLEASVVKDLGNIYEQQLPVLIQAVIDDVETTDTGVLPELMTTLLQAAPSFSLRGGTREIIRGIIARGLGLR